MALFHPKLVSIDGEMDGFILLDNVFTHEECIEYCKKHRYNIKFICSNYTCATEILYKIQEAGYRLKFYKVHPYVDVPAISHIEVRCYLEGV